MQAILAPIRRVRRGLIPALGGRKAFGSWLLVAARQSASVGIALRTGSRCVCSSVAFVWRAHISHASRFPASVAMICLRPVFRSRCGRFGDHRLRVRGARSGISASVFGKSAIASPSPASCPPNKSFKPTPCPGFVETSWHAGNTGSHPSRSARLNSGVRRQKSILQLCCSQT